MGDEGPACSLIPRRECLWRDVDAICVHVSLDLRSLPAKPQPANRCPLPLNLRWDQFGLTSRYWSERQRRAQKLFLEEGGRTQNVNRSLEIRFRRRKTRTVRRKCDAKSAPLRGKRFWNKVAGHKTQNANHSAEMHNAGRRETQAALPKHIILGLTN